MSNASSTILTQLSQRGYRLTQARARIVDALHAASSPLTIQALVDLVAVDEASVYRTIKLLVSEDLAEEIPVQQGKTQYALAHDHHHHVVCNECGHIAHVPCQTVPAPKKPDNFALIQRHEVTYYGVCKECSV